MKDDDAADRDAILSRRTYFVAAALATMVGAGCGEDKGVPGPCLSAPRDYDAGARTAAATPCLTAVPVETSTAPTACLSAAAPDPPDAGPPPPDAGPAASDAGAGDAGTTKPRPRPCLSVEPLPRPCLTPKRSP